MAPQPTPDRSGEARQPGVEAIDPARQRARLATDQEMAAYFASEEARLRQEGAAPDAIARIMGVLRGQWRQLKSAFDARVRQWCNCAALPPTMPAFRSEHFESCPMSLIQEQADTIARQQSSLDALAVAVEPVVDDLAGDPGDRVVILDRKPVEDLLAAITALLSSRETT